MEIKFIIRTVLEFLASVGVIVMVLNEGKIIVFEDKLLAKAKKFFHK